MVASNAAVAIALPEQPSSADFVDTPATLASIAGYLASGERTGEVANLAFKVFTGLLVLIALAWLVGVLPGAVKVF